MGTFWAKIISTITGQTIGEVLEYKAKKAQLKQEIQLEKIRGKIKYEEMKTARAERSEGRDHEWELESIRNSGWKDEWVLVILSIPMVLVFVPWTQGTILDGFAALETTPEWFRWMVMMIYGATFGIRVWRRKM